MFHVAHAALAGIGLAALVLVGALVSLVLFVLVGVLVLYLIAPH